MSRKSKTEGELAVRILKVVGLGVLWAAVSVAAPTFPYFALKVYLKKKFNKSYSSDQMYNAVYYLRRKKFIAYKNNKYILTKTAKQYIDHKAVYEIEIKSISWDYKWRVVSFDIPENKLKARHIFRAQLRRMGFYHFQRSVFITPYPCEQEIITLAKQIGVAESVHILVCERFSSDHLLVARFEL